MLKNGLCSLTGPGFLCHWSSLWTDNICPKAILPYLPIILEQSLRIEPGNCLVLNDFFFFLLYCGGKIDYKEFFHRLVFTLQTKCPPIWMSPWAITGSGLGFVRLIRLFPFSSESGMNEQKFSHTARKGVYREIGGTRVLIPTSPSKIEYLS